MVFGHRRRRYLVGMGILAACAVPSAFLFWTILDWGSSGLPPALTIILLSIVTALLIFATRPWWRALDEMEKEAQLTSWYWGGSLGLCVGIMTTVVLGGPGSTMTQGAIIAGGAQVIFFLLFWVGWRIMHRPRAS